jgi:ABC-type Fe3+ transport system substrate-binding protein
MNAKIAILAAFAAAVVLVLYLTNRGSEKTDPVAVPLTAISAASSRAVQVDVSMVYSSEKKDWIEDSAITFRRAHPEVKLTLVARGSLDAAQSILDEKDKSLVFSPADSLVLSLFASDYRTKFRAEPFGVSGDDAPQSLVITPFVFVVWEDRATALAKTGGGTITWKALNKAVTSNKGWPDVGGKAEWGFVKLGHTDPTQSNSGMQALVLMAYEFLEKTSGLSVGDLLKPELQKFVKGIEKGVTKFESSTGTFMTDMIRFGPSKYDVAAVYENLAIAQIENAQGRWGNLRVYYPKTTLWSDHPVVLLEREGTSDAQRTAAKQWIAHLRSRAVQERALAFGFRPGDTTVAVKTADAQNPFTRLAQYGVKLEIPPVATVPDEPVIRNLITMWSRVVDNSAR